MTPEAYPHITPPPASEPPPRPPEREPGLGDAVRFVQRHWAVLASSVAVTLVIVVGWGLLFVESAWQATAILIVSEPTFSSELTPGQRPAKAYRELLQSGAVLDETQRRVARESGIEDLRLNVRSEIVLDGSSNPMLRLVAQARDADLAALEANTWAQVAVEQTQRLVTRTAERSIALAEERHERAAREVQDLEAGNLEMRVAFEKRTNLLTTEWERKISAALERTTDLIAAYQIETEESFRAIGSKVSGSAVDPGLEGELLQLAAVKRELAQTLPYLSLEKTVSEDILWQWLGEEAADAEPQIVRQLGNLTGLRLNDHELNPVFVDLSQRSIDLELGMRRDGLLGSWEGSEDLLEDLERAYRERSAGLTNLLAERQSLQNGLRASYRSELGALRQRFRVDVSRVRRELEAASELLISVAPTLEEAKLARSELEADRDGLEVLQATPPHRPMPRRLMLRALAAVVLGSILGVVLATIRQVTRQGRRDVGDPASL